MSDVQKDEKGKVCGMTESERRNIEMCFDGDDEYALSLLLLIALVECLTSLASPLGRNHACQHVRSLLIWLFWGFATCGIGWLVLIPSLCRWRKKARLAARAGRMIERW